MGTKCYILFENGTWVATTELDVPTREGAQSLFRNDPVAAVVPAETGLKPVLMHLGNKLVTDRGFAPGVSPGGRLAKIGTNTAAIMALTVFLNSYTDAREALAELGFNWSVTRQQLLESE